MAGWVNWRELFRQSCLFQRARLKFSQRFILWIHDKTGYFQGNHRIGSVLRVKYRKTMFCFGSLRCFWKAAN